MPITQSRMISLIHAAQDFQQALYKAQSIAEDSIAEGDELETIKAKLFIALSPQRLLIAPLLSPQTLALEAAHFSKHAESNERARARVRVKRGVPQARKQTENETQLHSIAGRYGTFEVQSQPQSDPMKELLSQFDNTISREERERIIREAEAASGTASGPTVEQGESDDEDNDIGPDVEIE